MSQIYCIKPISGLVNLMNEEGTQVWYLYIHLSNSVVKSNGSCQLLHTLKPITYRLQS